MRTRVLICAAALVAASAFTSMAQVYSQNVVGYVNVPVVDGFQLVANPLDVDGTGTNNMTATVLGTNVPAGTVVYTWNGTGYNIAKFISIKGAAPAWQNSYSLAPGQGAWVSIPTGGATALGGNLTFVGQVMQGSLVNANVPAAGGFSLVSSMVPIAGGLQTALGYTPQALDQVYQWNPTAKAYTINKFVSIKGQPAAWNPAEPQIGVGEGFWLDSQKGGAWSNYFKVN